MSGGVKYIQREPWGDFVIEHVEVKDILEKNISSAYDFIRNFKILIRLKWLTLDEMSKQKFAEFLNRNLSLFSEEDRVKIKNSGLNSLAALEISSDMINDSLSVVSYLLDSGWYGFSTLRRSIFLSAFFVNIYEIFRNDDEMKTFLEKGFNVVFFSKTMGKMIINGIGTLSNFLGEYAEEHNVEYIHKELACVNVMATVNEFKSYLTDGIEQHSHNINIEIIKKVEAIINNLAEISLNEKINFDDQIYLFEVNNA